MDLDRRLNALEARLAGLERQNASLSRSRRRWRLGTTALATLGLAVASLGMARFQAIPQALSFLNLVDGGGASWGTLAIRGGEGGALTLRGDRGSLVLSPLGLQFLDLSGRPVAAWEVSRDRASSLQLGGGEGPRLRLQPTGLHLQDGETRLSHLGLGTLRLKAGAEAEQALLEPSRLSLSEGGRERASLEVIPRKASELRLSQSEAQGTTSLRVDAEAQHSLVLGKRGPSQASLAVDAESAVLGLGSPASREACFLGVTGDSSSLQLKSAGADRKGVESRLTADWDGSSLDLRGFGQSKGLSVDLPTRGGPRHTTAASELYDSARDKVEKGKRLLRKLF